MKTKKARRRGGTKDERRGIDIPLRRRRQYAIPSPPFGGSSMSIASSAGQPDSTTLRAVPSVFSVAGKVVCRGGAATFPAHAAQRYNTLDFAEQSRVPTGASRPYWKPCAEGLAAPLRCISSTCEIKDFESHLWTPRHFLGHGTSFAKRERRANPRKCKTGAAPILSAGWMPRLFWCAAARELVARAARSSDL